MIEFIKAIPLGHHPSLWITSSVAQALCFCIASCFCKITLQWLIVIILFSIIHNQPCDCSTMNHQGWRQKLALAVWDDTVWIMEFAGCTMTELLRSLTFKGTTASGFAVFFLTALSSVFQRNWSRCSPYLACPATTSPHPPDTDVHSEIFPLYPHHWKSRSPDLRHSFISSVSLDVSNMNHCDISPMMINTVRK